MKSGKILMKFSPLPLPKGEDEGAGLFRFHRTRTKGLIFDSSPSPLLRGEERGRRIGAGRCSPSLIQPCIDLLNKKGEAAGLAAKLYWARST